jgi:hypothetical protein
VGLANEADGPEDSFGVYRARNRAEKINHIGRDRLILNTTLQTLRMRGVHMGNGTGRLCILLVLIFWCLAASGSAVPSVQAAEEGAFTGTWDANGSKELLALGSERETSTFKLSGHVRLTNKIGKESDYWADCIGLSDSVTGSEIRCVWRSMDGEEIYLVMKGARMEKGSSITGTIIGGTGQAKGITGTLRFTWSMIFNQESETAIGGFSNDLSGTYKLP